MYYDILRAIQEESQNTEGAKSTRVQYRSNMSYDKLANYIVELESRKMITKTDALFLTEKGLKYLNEYEKIKDFIQRMGIEYLSE
jgi:predicted transcriptional regulator